MVSIRTGALDLGDARRTRRYIELVDLASKSFGQSIAKLGENVHHSKAFYRLLANPQLNVQSILQAHQHSIDQRVADEQVVLYIQDTTELDYTNKPQTRGLGRLNYEARHGMYAHVSLCVTPQGVPLGISDVWSWARSPKAQADVRESIRWLEGYQIACDTAARHQQTRYVYVADREADMSDLIQLAADNDHQVDYLIRARHNRVLGGKQRLFDTSHEPLGEIGFELTIRGRHITRQVRQQLWARSVTLPCGHAITIVIAKECNPPPGSKAVEWRLITNRCVSRLEEAAELVQWYRQRWLIETLFMILKVGCKLEERQFGSMETLERVLVTYLLVSYRILLIQRLARSQPDMNCEAVFNRQEWQIAYQIRYRRRPPEKAPNMREMVRLIAEMGGFLGRKSDGEPGVKTLWMGLLDLAKYLYAHEVMSSIQ